MHLIYSQDLTSARTFALRQDLAPGDWKWIKDGRVVRDYPRSEIFKLRHWEANPHHVEIDAALKRASQKRRMGPLTDLS